MKLLVVVIVGLHAVLVFVNPPTSRCDVVGLVSPAVAVAGDTADMC